MKHSFHSANLHSNFIKSRFEMLPIHPMVATYARRKNSLYGFMFDVGESRRLIQFLFRGEDQLRITVPRATTETADGGTTSGEETRGVGW